MGLGVFVHVVHLLIDVVEQCRDKLHRGHAALLSGKGCHTDQHGGVVGRRQAQKCVLIVCKGLYIFIVCQRLTPSVIYAPLTLYREMPHGSPAVSKVRRGWQKGAIEELYRLYV